MATRRQPTRKTIQDAADALTKLMSAIDAGEIDGKDRKRRKTDGYPAGVGSTQS
jgi:hypothetical protein